MAKIPASFKQLKTAYQKHKALGESGEEISHHLLKFYAAECGLKALILHQNNLQDTSQVSEKELNHDIQRLAKTCNLPNNGFTQYTKETHIPISKLHEYLRYGIDISDSIKESQIKYLTKIIEQLKNKL